jgi:hypothetical protein
MTTDILQLPYSERQLVVVQPDEVVAATRKAQTSFKSGNAPVDWKAVALRVGKEALNFTIFGPITEVTIEALSAWAKARDSGLNVLQISRTDATRLQFPPGHPREQALYVAHPALPSVYYTTASFHRMAFEHKFSEAIYLLMSLGATQITVEHVRGWSREFSAKLSAPIPKADAKIGASRTSASESSLLFEATLKNTQNPAIPTDLVWYLHEPTWQAIAKGRTQFGLSQFSLTVNYEDDFGVNAGLKVRVQKAGLDLGGNFEDHTATTWKIHGTFASDA